MSRVTFSPAAAADINAIWDYTVGEWGTDQADRYTDDIRDVCDSLAQGKKRGRTVDIRDGHPSGVFADHRRLHAVIQDFFGHAVHRREGRDVTAHDRLQVLARDKPAPEPAAVAQNEREQPDLARDAGARR